MRRDSLAIIVVLALVSPVSAQDAAGEKRGELLLTRHCSGCHAIGRSGASQHPEAPPFRVLSRRYPIEALEEALGEGLISGHPEMPETPFSGGDVGAIVSYLNSIQER